MRRDKIHQAKADRFDPRLRRNLKRALQRQRRFDQHVQRQGRAASGVQRLQSALHIGHAFDLGQHQVGQPLVRPPDDALDVGPEGRVPHRVHPHPHARRHRRRQIEALQQLDHQGRVLGLAAYRGAVFAVERDVEHAAAVALAVLGLQRQALAHARRHAAVMVTHRQQALAGLRAHQQVAWVHGALPHVLQQVVYSRCRTPSCSPCSSARVLLMHSWLKASMGSPGTIW